MFKNNNIFSLFVVCPPGIEAVLENELKKQGIKKMRREVGGISLKCDFKMLMRLNLWLRSASRILIRLSSFMALHLDQLERPLLKVPFELFFEKGSFIPIRVTCSHSRLYHSGAVGEKISNILDELGYKTSCAQQEDDEKSPAVPLLYFRLSENIVEISVNSSGEHLYRRGYKEEIGPAPLRENLAAAMLLHIGYHGQWAFWDPCAGSGTIPIEAALIAANIAPGIKRRFAFFAWPIFEKSLFESELKRAKELIKKPVFPIFASDISPKSSAMINNNALRAAVDSTISINCEALEDIKEPPLTHGGLLLVNPPYGERIHGVNGLKNLYASLGKIAENYPKIALYILSPKEELLRLTERNFENSGLSFRHGGMPVTLYKI